MAAPEYVPSRPGEKVRTYTSPDHVPEGWVPDRPGDLTGRQPRGPMLGSPGPDQGYGLVLAQRLRDRLHLAANESADDAVHGCLAIALRRASLFGRAPVVHDLTIAYTVWGYLDPTPPTELVERRRRLFEGVSSPTHHYGERRALVDSIPEATLRMGHHDVAAAYPGRWQELLARADGG